ncbi:MAG TPA: hypothetical protein DIW17_06345 [Clostridiales bacterium]|nr:hypothetical protein [Clostridia bacterium]HCS73476.1 hypothetical protein [Clostridiales bacterium]
MAHSLSLSERAQSWDEVSFNVGGIDHCSFFIDVKVREDDALKLMREKGLIDAAWRGESVFVSNNPYSRLEYQRIRFVLWDILGYLPAIGDEHIAEFFYQAIGTSELREQFGTHYDRIAERTNMVRRAKSEIKAGLDIGQVKLMECGEILDQVIAALNGGPKITDVLNYKNIGQIQNMPSGFVVESICNVDALGVHPVVGSTLPPIIESIVRPMTLRQQLYMEAAMQWDEKKLIAALATDPIVNDFLRVKDVARDIMQYNKQFLTEE